MALTSMCPAICDNNSERKPVSTLTTPGGTSLVASTSLKVIALRGFFSEASEMQVLPPRRIGQSNETKPSNALASGAISTTTPVGSGTENTKCGEATGFTVLNNCWYL